MPSPNVTGLSEAEVQEVDDAAAKLKAFLIKEGHPAYIGAMACLVVTGQHIGAITSNGPHALACVADCFGVIASACQEVHRGSREGYIDTEH